MSYRKINYLNRNRIVYNRSPINDQPTKTFTWGKYYQNGTYECYELFKSKAKINSFKSLKWHLLVLKYLNPELEDKDFNNLAYYITNKKNNECNFHIIKGFASKRKLNLTNLNDYFGGYGATSIEDKKSKIPIYEFKALEARFKLNFNTLVADCEGFLDVFLQENPQIYKNFSKIIFEADYPNKCDYDKIYKNLSKNNFKKILKGHQNVFLK